MKEYNIHADMHRFGPDPVRYPFFIRMKNCVDLGDNFEFKNIAEKDLVFAHKEFRAHKKFMKDNNNIIVRDNHSVIHGHGLPPYVIRNGIIWFHGQRVFYKTKRWMKWENRYAGRGPVGRSISFGISKLRCVFKRKGLKLKELEKVYKYVELISLETGIDIHTAVFGHTHPDKLIDLFYWGLRIVNVPRGLTTIEL